jgi:hypothetical protein
MRTRDSSTPRAPTSPALVSTSYNEGSRTSQYQIAQNGFGFDDGYTWARVAELRVFQDEYWYSVSKRIDFDDLSIPAQLQSVSTLQFNLNAADTLISEAWDGSFAVVARTARSHLRRRGCRRQRPSQVAIWPWPHLLVIRSSPTASYETSGETL